MLAATRHWLPQGSREEPSFTFFTVCLQPVINTMKALDLKFRMLDVLSDIGVVQVFLVVALEMATFVVAQADRVKQLLQGGGLACAQFLCLRPLATDSLTSGWLWPAA